MCVYTRHGFPCPFRASFPFYRPSPATSPAGTWSLHPMATARGRALDWLNPGTPGEPQVIAGIYGCE